MKTRIFFLLLLVFSFDSVSQITLLRDFAGTFSGNPAKGNPNNTIVFNNKLYFNVEAADGLTRLYSSDGTISGTSALKYGTGSNQRFISENPNWKILETSTGDFQLGYIALDETQASSSNIEGHTYLNISYTNGDNFKKQNYTEKGLLEVINDDFYFFKNNTNFHRLHKLDSEGNLTPSVQWNKPVKKVFKVKNKLYISGDSGLGNELYQYDPANDSSLLIADLNPNGDSDPSDFVGINDLLYFSANDGSGRKLYYLDTQAFQLNLVSYSNEPSTPVFFNRTGSTNAVIFSRFFNNSRTLAIASINQSSTSVLTSNISLVNPESLTSFNGYLYFAAENSNSERELYRTDAITLQSTELVAKINSNGSSNPRNFLEYNNNLYFSANDGINGEELWKVDQNNNVSLVEDFVAGAGSFSPIPLAVFDGKLYLNGFKNNTERELYTYTDSSLSTEGVAKLNASIYPNPTSKEFTIKNVNNIKRVKLYSIKGKLLKEYKGVNTNLYDVSNLSKGIYLIKVETENFVLKTGKIIIQ